MLIALSRLRAESSRKRIAHSFELYDKLQHRLLACEPHDAAPPSPATTPPGSTTTVADVTERRRAVERDDTDRRV
jgi:hypothetical protein